MTPSGRGHLRVSPRPCTTRKWAGKRRIPRGPASLLSLRSPIGYRRILRARRPPATSKTPAPSAISGAPPVGGSAPPAALAAEAEAVAYWGAAAASIIASIAANNIAFLTLLPFLLGNALSGEHSFTDLLQGQHHPAHFF